MRSDNEFINGLLHEMMAELETNLQFLPSEFWRDINAKNIAMIDAEGLENFKRTVSQNYFNWLITNVEDPQYSQAIGFWKRHPSIRPLVARIESNISLRFTTSTDAVRLSFFQRFSYKIFVSLIWSQMLKHDHRKLSNLLSEPKLGNPIKIWQNGRLISQDLANSIVECNLMLDAVDGLAQPRVAELGAGSGRLAHAFCSIQHGKYMIFDIPPALIVSQWYLSALFPEKKIFSFRRFMNFEEVREELEECDIAFLSANQMAQFPDQYFDLVASISTLPEMRPDQFEMYLGLFDRISSHSVYLKQWLDWYNPLDDAHYNVDDFVLGENWELSSHVIDPINPRFFNRVWKRS